jgi:hypothetical protein
LGSECKKTAHMERTLCASNELFAYPSGMQPPRCRLAPLALPSEHTPPLPHAHHGQGSRGATPASPPGRPTETHNLIRKRPVGPKQLRPGWRATQAPRQNWGAPLPKRAEERLRGSRRQTSSGRVRPFLKHSRLLTVKSHLLSSRRREGQLDPEHIPGWLKWGKGAIIDKSRQPLRGRLLTVKSHLLSSNRTPPCWQHAGGRWRRQRNHGEGVRER